ncbi:Formyltransferase [Laetiporus sulphureus 93-53]|uniref:methionyl-tRNA formyltransferase n=1 Tax=Laetiporus sulphureus 93-53 TaxID=1314785 RepID=A0A165BKV1_9APHY|nr:Formyltransferase [Laetiporus sulphureus 93-53]KZT01238.1 Formyltransferase [Laetiporus sulphureus 93-53]
MGRDEFSCLVLEQLYRARDVWTELLVVTQPDVKTGRRGSQLSVSPLKILAQELDLPVHFIPPDKATFKTWQLPPPFSLASTSNPPSSHVLITASFGRILPASMLKLFLPSRRLNVHPSLLPAYRGAAPIQHTLLGGQKETGVCVIEMMERKKGVDAGAIWAQSRMDVPDGATFETMRDILSREGGRLLVSVLRDTLAGKATSTPQLSDPSASRAPAITAEDSAIDFTTMSAEHIVRRYRAISHQKPLIAQLKIKKNLQLHSPSICAEVSGEIKASLMSPGLATYDPRTQSLIIRCADDSFLAVPQVKQQDRSLLKAKEWWNGVRPEMRVSGEGEGPVEFVRWDVS